MLTIDVSEVKLPGEAKQNNLPPECGQPIDDGGSMLSNFPLVSQNIPSYQALFPIKPNSRTSLHQLS
jgi:hypothetical protein